jgi:phytanoyl-CoA hydroxylase
MLGRFLQPNAKELIGNLGLDDAILARATDVVEKGYTVIPASVSAATCRQTIAAFRAFERRHDAIFAENRNGFGHYPRIVNLHNVFPELLRLFTRNPALLGTLDALFGAPASVYTSLFYEVGSQQPMHRDTPVFSTRPEYLYFGTTVYLEPADDGNGCLEVQEGGHTMAELDRETMASRRYGSLDTIPALDNEMWMEYQNKVVDTGRSAGLATKKLHVKAGDAVIWHPQLPHGGTPIADPTRTRFSLVMHVTPVGVPVYHQNVFFNPSRDFSEQAPWTYHSYEDRQVADQRHGVSFGHEKNYAMDRFAEVPVG